MAMFGLEQFLQTQDPLFLERGTLVNMGVGIVALLSACVWMFNHLDKVTIDKVHIASILLVAVAFVSQYWTLAPREFSEHYYGAIPYFILFLFVAPVLSMDQNGIQTGVWTMLVIGVPLVFLFVFFVQWEGRGVRLAAPSLENGVVRWDSPSLALSTLAAYTGILCVILVPKSKLLLLVQFVAFTMACYVAYRTQSRGQLIAMGFVCLVCYPLANQATKFKGLFFTIAGFATLSIGLFLLFSYFDLGDINRWGEEKIRSDFEGRFDMAENLIARWMDSSPQNIIFGLGAASGFATSGFYVHNLPAEILGELGLFGAMIYCYIYFYTVKRAYSIIRKLEHYPKMRKEVVALIALFMFSSIVSFKQGSLFTWPDLLFLAVAIGHVEGHSSKFVAKKRKLSQLFLRPDTLLQPSPQHGQMLPHQ